ncbi:hypothetical protein C8R43DRAFT_1026865 [Mycena crocata]|nr:hypothetical protein C8R43DRAFT_1026865 [Mycena crocata]
MSSPRHAGSPLRDRLLSNSPDPIKNKILRDSGLGWADTPASSGSPNVSPLRISKRDSPVRRQPGDGVARRTSSSFKHVRNNNLVSKSPFKSQIPTANPNNATPRPFPTPSRRVSGEKRQRPQSIHDQAEAENDRPFALKRERRQSKTFQGLIQKEPVTKSPFRTQSQAEDAPPVPQMPPVPPTPSRIPVPATGPSPARSSLVSKRMHGPRLSGRRERRKTVTFDERCDVVEFDRDEEDGPFDDSGDEYGEPEGHEEDEEDDDPFSAPDHQQEGQHHQQPEESSYESIDLSDAATVGDGSHLPDTPMPMLDLDPDTSITGLVDAMFFAPNAGQSTPPPTPGPKPGSAHTRTFEFPSDSDHPSDDQYAHEHSQDHATDLDTEDGVPFGRSHHAARAAAFHANQHAQHANPPPPMRLASPERDAATHSRPLPLPNMGMGTPPHRSSPMPRPNSASILPSPPLGRTTHLERRRDREAAVPEDDEEEEQDVARLPGSPSPAPARHRGGGADYVEIGVPRFELSGISGGATDAEDPFALPRLRDEPLPDVSGRDLSLGGQEEEQTNSGTGTPSQSQSQSQGSNGRPRISREEVQRRLMRARSASPEVEQQQQQQREREDAMEDGEEYSRDESRGDEPEDSSYAHSREEGSYRDDEDEFREEREEEARYEREQERQREQEQEREASASTELGTVETAEKRVLPVQPALTLHAPATPTREDAPTQEDTPHHGNTELGLRAPGPGLDLDFGSRFGMGGLGIPGLSGSVGSRMSAMSGGEGLRAAERREPERMAVDMDMRSALDRLMDDVAGGRPEGEGDDSVRTEEDTEEAMNVDRHGGAGRHTQPVTRAATDSALLQMGGGVGTDLSRNVSVASSSSLLSLPPPVPPKDNIRSREAMIIEKRREMRRFEDGDYDYTPPPAVENNTHLRAGRPSARRSMSTGDAEELARMRGKGLLDVGEGKDDLLGDSIEKELANKLATPHKRVRFFLLLSS